MQYNSTTPSLARQFAVEYARGVVPGMLHQIKAAKRDTRLIVAAVLAIIYPHQAMWLTTIHGVDRLGWAIPLVVDLAMLRCLGIVQTVSVRRPAKVAALVMAGVLGTMSGTVNISVPGAVAARAIFGALVLVAVGMKVVTSLVGPDFRSMEAAEQDAVKPELTPQQKAAATRAANLRALAAMTPQQRGAVKRRQNAAKKAAAVATAPVSPGRAPVTLTEAESDAFASTVGYL